MDIPEIIQRCKHKDERAFRLLVDHYSGFVFSVVFRILNDEDESKDILQESFITVWKNLEKFDREMPFENWLYKIVVNKCLDALRNKKRRALEYPDTHHWNIPEIISNENPETILSNKEMGQIILQLTGMLSPKQKVVFVLCDLEGLSHDEIATITGMAKSTIKSNLNFARRNIGKMIEKHRYHESTR